MAAPPTESLASLARAAVASDPTPTAEKLDIAAEMEALRAMKTEGHGEAEKPFDMDKFFRLVEQRPPPTPDDIDLHERIEVLHTKLEKTLNGKWVKRTDAEMYFAGTAKMMGLKQAFLHQEHPTAEMIRAETRSAAEMVADKIKIYELEKRVKALQNQLAQQHQ